MDDFDKWLKEERKREEEERLAFLKKCTDKVKDNNDLIYHLLALGLCERFDLKLSYCGIPNVVWPILNYYVDNVDMDWDEWLTADDAPMIKPISRVKYIFPELAEIYDDEKDIIKLANKLYNLEMYDDDYDLGAEYVYAFSFDFNSFEPLPVNEIKEIKNEKEILLKYGYDTTELDKKLLSYGLSNEELEVI